MTHYERFIGALRGEPTDRAPVIGGWVCQQRFLQTMSDTTPDEFWDKPRQHTIEAYKRADADVMVQFVLPKRSDAATEGSGGRETNFTRQEAPPGHQFPDPESVIGHVRERPSASEVAKAFDSEAAYDSYLQLVQTGAAEMDPIVWVPGHVCGCPHFMWYSSFGYENYLTALHEAPEAFYTFFEALGEEQRLKNSAVARATVEHDLIPVIYCGQDICYGEGPLCSPNLLEEIYFPHLSRALEPLKDAGLMVVWHSDGNIMPIIEQLIECGVDGFQGLEEDHGMDLAEVAGMTNRDGVPLIVWGSVSVTSTLPHGSIDDIRTDVRRCLDVGAERGGRMFLAPSSSVGPEVPTENIVEFFRYGGEYGLQAYGSV